MREKGRKRKWRNTLDDRRREGEGGGGQPERKEEKGSKKGVAR